MLSKKDKALMRLDPNDPDDDTKIEPNSQYDTTIALDSSSSDHALQPGEYSPRPSPTEAMQAMQILPPENDGGALGNFQIKFGGQDPDLNQPFTFSNSNADAYSPRPNMDPSNNFSGFKQNFGIDGMSGLGGFSNVAGIGMGMGMGNNSGTDNLGMGSFGNTASMDLHASFGGGGSTPELAQLFGLLSKFQPPPLELAPHFKPFLPELIPAIGQIDAFIKVPRPDGTQDPLGLTVLDEPTIGQSNPQILRMQLREKFGVVPPNESDGLIGRIEDPVHHQKNLDSFLDSYEEISRNRPAPQMAYSSTMPDTPQLMEEFPPELKEVLQSAAFPKAEADLNLEEYAQTICAMLDIPVRGNVIESLHLLFTLYQEFHDNIYFNPHQSRESTPASKPQTAGAETVTIS